MADPCETCPGLIHVFDVSHPCHKEGSCSVDPQKACRTTGNTSTCGKYAQELYAAIVPDGSRRKQRFICKNLLKFFGTSRILCCFYADPVAPMQLNLKPLKMLTHEMKNVINLLSPVDVHVEPATTLDDGNAIEAVFTTNCHVVGSCIRRLHRIRKLAKKVRKNLCIHNKAYKEVVVVQGQSWRSHRHCIWSFIKEMLYTYTHPRCSNY